MNKEKFKQDVELLKVTTGVPKSQHTFSPLEDSVAYYCALTNKTNKDYIDLIVTRLNLLSGNKLKVTSFNSRIANMNYEINKKGLARNSEQGTLIAKYIKTFLTTNSLNTLDLKTLINFTAGREVL